MEPIGSPTHSAPAGSGGMAISGRGGRRRRRVCSRRPGWRHPGVPDEGEVQVSRSVWERIEESRARHNVLEHPFYVRWSAGELTPEELARYAGQYRHATEALARLCHQAADQAPKEHRAEIEAHATEEAGHIRLWDGFVEAAGGAIGAGPRQAA